MSATEAEVQQQIEETREALQTIKTSLRRSTLVRLLGVVVGLVIVLGYLWLFYRVAKEIEKSPEVRQAFVEYFERLELGKKAAEVAEGIAPTYLEEVRNVMEETGLQEAALQELQTFGEEARPIIREQMERVRPRLVKSIEAQADRTYRELETELRGQLEQRLRQMIRRQTETLQEDTELSEQQLSNLLDGLVAANRQALQNVIGRRWERNNARLQRIQDLILQFPPVPPNVPQEELQDQLGKCLLALLKENLPEYDFQRELELPGYPGP